MAILACHNRRELTLRALAALEVQKAVFDLSAVLFDDGSSDGTADAVRERFPGTIVLHGDGNAFWNGGMHRAWQRARELDPDAFLWLNDDVALDGDALARLQAAWTQAAALSPGGACVLVGATRSSSGEQTYGGMRRKRSPLAFRLEPVGLTDRLTRVDTGNGNIVLVPAATVRRIGILDPGYFHMYGDIDYGLRATAAGIPVLQLPGTLGVCERQPAIDLGAMGLAERWRHLLRGPRGTRPASWWRMVRKHSGIWAPLHFLSPYRKLFYPAAWLGTKR